MLIAALARLEPLSPAILCTLNRLSDHLFVLGRVVNENGRRDVTWIPGANR
jgi:cob(I)alamin adenosyltransferase